jgi:hypothetical protein
LDPVPTQVTPKVSGYINYSMSGFLQVIAEVTTATGLFHNTWKLSDYISDMNKNYLILRKLHLQRIRTKM